MQTGADCPRTSQGGQEVCAHVAEGTSREAHGTERRVCPANRVALWAGGSHADGRTDTFNGRKKRKAYTFSKELSFHEACTWLVVVWYNFGWCVRTLREKVQAEPPRYHYRTPAMAAGLADHAWAMRELLCYPLYPTQEDRQRSKIRTYKEVLERLESVLAIEAPT